MPEEVTNQIMQTKTFKYRRQKSTFTRCGKFFGHNEQFPVFAT